MYSSPDYNTNLVYQSDARPMGEEVVRILRGMADDLSLFGDVLILGDSTSAYCGDREKETSWRELRDKAHNECGVNFISESWPGATPRAFLNQAANDACRCSSYGWVILFLGGGRGGFRRDSPRRDLYITRRPLRVL